MKGIKEIFSVQNQSTNSWDDILVKLVGVTGIVLILFSLFSLAGWLIGLRFLLVINKDYLPIDPVTATFFVFIGFTFIIKTITPRGFVLNLIPKILLVIILVYSLLKFAGYFLSTDLLFEDKFFPVIEKAGNFPIKRMSHVTGLLFILSAFCLLFLTRPGAGLKISNIAAGSGFIISLAGFITEVGYLYHTPFFYSGNVIPLASRTGLSFLITGLGIMFLSGRKTFVLKHLTDSAPYSRILRIFIPLMIAIFLIQAFFDMTLSHSLQINEALVLSITTFLSVLIGIPVIVKVTTTIFYEATVAEKERSRALAELDRMLKEHKLILENNPLGICMVKNDKIQWSNTGFCNTFSKQYSENTDHIFSDLFPQEIKESLFQQWITELKSGKIVDNPVEFKEPSVRWLRFIGTLLEDEVDALSVIWIVEDITERKIQRQTMRLLSHTLSSLSECVSITDTSDRIIFVNKAFENTYGYTDKEITGKNISIVGSEKNSSKVTGSILPSTNSGTGWSGELINRRKDGSEFPVYLNTSKVSNEKNEIIALVGIAVDITERRKAEKREKEYIDQLKMSNEAKDKLFSIISHDLRSPFTAIMGIVELLSEQFDTLSETEKKAFVKGLRNSTENTFNLIENLLTWSRSQRGGINVSPSNVNISEIIREQAGLLSEAAIKKDISIKLTIPESLITFTDREMTGTVIRNFINNAIKFTPRGGSITINTVRSENSVEVAVTDSGVGITQDKIEKVFGLEQTASTPGTENEKGTGLGLIICKEFVEKNGGKIHVESTPGKGSTFSFTIPLRD